jgi:protoporphyrinogen oxidase
MESFALSRFGPEITRRVIEPLMRRTYDRPARQISTLASVLLRLDRIVLFDEPFFQELMGSPTLRSCVAYPEQRNLDLSYASGRGSYYPRLFGIHRVIDALVERCRVQGIETRVSTGVEEIGIERGAVSSLTLSSGQRLPVHSLIWTAGVIPLARKLGVHPVGLPADPPLSTAIVNFLFDHPTDMEDLYYFYCLDPGYRAYRITNFSAYCPNAPRAGGWPICVELLQLPGQSLEANLLKEQALAELRGFGVLPPAAKVLFSDARVLERGFPLPSVDNMNLIGKCREAIAEAELSNLQMMGVLSKPGLFFQTDVVRDVWENVMAGNACAA